MPAVFFSGSVEFFIKPNKSQLKALKDALKENVVGLDFSYEDDGLPCTFYLNQFNLTDGVFSVEPEDKDVYRVKYEGVAKVQLSPSAAAFVAKKDAALNIRGLNCHPYNLAIHGGDSKVIPSPLKVSKTKPK